MNCIGNETGLGGTKAGGDKLEFSSLSSLSLQSSFGMSIPLSSFGFVREDERGTNEVGKLEAKDFGEPKDFDLLNGNLAEAPDAGWFRIGLDCNELLNDEIREERLEELN